MQQINFNITIILFTNPIFTQGRDGNKARIQKKAAVRFYKVDTSS